MSALLLTFLGAKAFPGSSKKACPPSVGAETRHQRNLSCCEQDDVISQNAGPVPAPDLLCSAALQEATGQVGTGVAQIWVCCCSRVPSVPSV